MDSGVARACVDRGGGEDVVLILRVQNLILKINFIFGINA